MRCRKSTADVPHGGMTTHTRSTHRHTHPHPHAHHIQTNIHTYNPPVLPQVVRGIFKLTILATVSDKTVSVDALEDALRGEHPDFDTGLEDYVQSVDIAAFNKI